MVGKAELTPIEITMFDLPPDYAKRWTEGKGMFWMQLTATDQGLQRWTGAVKRGKEWIDVALDVDPVKKYAYLNGKSRVRAAKVFVAAYGGMTFREGKIIDLKTLADEESPPAAAQAEPEAGEAFAIVCGSDRTSSTVVRIPVEKTIVQPEAAPPGDGKGKPASGGHPSISRDDSQPVDAAKAVEGGTGAGAPQADEPASDPAILLPPSSAPANASAAPVAAISPNSKPCPVCKSPCELSGSVLGGLKFYWCSKCNTEWG